MRFYYCMLPLFFLCKCFSQLTENCHCFLFVSVFRNSRRKWKLSISPSWHKSTTYHNFRPLCWCCRGRGIFQYSFAHSNRIFCCFVCSYFPLLMREPTAAFLLPSLVFSPLYRHLQTKLLSSSNCFAPCWQLHKGWTSRLK